MKKLLPMVVLFLGFVAGIVVLFFLFQKRNPGNFVSVPVLSPTPTIFSNIPTLTPAPEVSAIDNDLTQINSDLDKLKKEDNRFTPPTFIFDLGIKQ